MESVGPVAQTGRALPLQGRGPGFKSRWVHYFFFLVSIYINGWYFFYVQHLFCGGIVCEGMVFFFIDYLCISNPTGTNKPNFSCLLCKICWKKHFFFCVMFFFSDVFMFDTGIFFCSVYYWLFLTRLIVYLYIVWVLFFLENIATCTIWGIAGLELPMKVVVSCVKLGVGADILWSQDCLMGLPKWFLYYLIRWGLGTHWIETS